LKRVKEEKIAEKKRLAYYHDEIQPYPSLLVKKPDAPILETPPVVLASKANHLETEKPLEVTVENSRSLQNLQNGTVA
jgi:hypothetical protein